MNDACTDLFDQSPWKPSLLASSYAVTLWTYGKNADFPPEDCLQATTNEREIANPFRRSSLLNERNSSAACSLSPEK